jgi:hypothetical protein
MASDSGTATQTRAPAMSRTPWYVMGAFIFIGLLGGVLIPKSSNKLTDAGARAVVLPTTDGPRTVVVPPCSPPVTVTQANVSAILSVQGTTAVTLPPAPGTRIVVVPRCVPGTPGSPSLPSSMFVLREGKQTMTGTSKSKSADPIAQGVLLQLLVPPGSPIRTIVVPRCTKKTKSKAGIATQLPNPPPGSTTVIAPPC